MINILQSHFRKVILVFRLKLFSYDISILIVIIQIELFDDAMKLGTKIDWKSFYNNISFFFFTTVKSWKTDLN